MTQPLLKVRDLSIAYATAQGILPVAENVRFDIYSGQCVGIVGESGCGKSAVAMSLVRLLPQPSGRILNGQVFFHGEDLVSMPIKRLRSIRGSKIGVVFQEPMQALNPTRRIGDQIAETLMFHRGLSEEDALARAVELLDRVQVAAPQRCARDYPHALSGGMRQRVVIACAIACAPELIIADEPTTALDVTVQQQVLSLLRELRRESGAASLLISHDLSVIAHQCDFVCVMCAGRIVEAAPVQELYANPRHAYTRALLAAILSDSVPRKSPLPTLPGSVPSPVDYVPGCRFCRRLGRTGDTTLSPLPLVEISPTHLVEACPLCTGE